MEDILIKNLDWAVLWDPTEHCHCYARGVNLGISGGRITRIESEPGTNSDTKKVIDGRNKLLVPGFINIHSHPDMEPLSKGLLEERSSPRLGMSALYEYMHLIKPDEETRRAATLFTIAELLKSGVTTFVDLSTPRKNWLDDLASTGIRTVLAPMYASARVTTSDGHSVDYKWDEAYGFDQMSEALEYIDSARAHPSGMIDGMVAPMRVDTCSEKMILSSLEEAKKRSIPMQIHTAQSLVEFNEMARRHGMSPVGWLSSIGCLDRSVILGHCIFLDDHPWVYWPEKADIQRLSEAPVSVAHCPVIFARKGILLNSFPRYIMKGVNVGIGTDTFPHNFLDEMRWAIILGKAIEGDITAGSTSMLLNAATIGGASALLRDDIGRIEKGAKADFFLVDLEHPLMHPLRDPLKNLFFSALERPVSDVFIEGRHVVKDGQILTFETKGLPATLTDGQKKAMMSIGERDYANRTPDQLFPLSIPCRESLPGQTTCLA